MEIHAHAPANLDPGGEDLPHICAALAWSWLHECETMICLNMYRRSFHFMCGDMGTEAGVPDFVMAQGISALVPEWRRGQWVDEGYSMEDQNLPE